MGRRDHYHVYVIELSKDVLYEAKFKKANLDYDYGKPCVYQGSFDLVIVPANARKMYDLVGSLEHGRSMVFKKRSGNKKQPSICKHKGARPAYVTQGQARSGGGG